MKKKIAILQSNYIPWKGYFDLIAAVDEFVVYDCVQYTKNDWRNRNQIKTAQGKAWLTVPVRHVSSSQLIQDVQIADGSCFRKHWNTFRQSYAKAEHISFCAEAFEPLFLGDLPRSLSEVNVLFIHAICDLLGIGTKITTANQYEFAGDRNERLIDICRQADADCYLSGPAAQSYLDEAAFAASGIRVEWMSYAGYREYTQPHPPFDPYVSVLDLIACTGAMARSFLLHGGGNA